MKENNGRNSISSRLRRMYHQHVLMLNRLEKLAMLDLETPISRAFQLYGDPVEIGPDDECSAAKQYTFFAGDFHDAVVCEWNGKIHSITYWSREPHPNRDLDWMFQYYGEGHDWRAWGEPGYLYIRDDRMRWLWCSAAPAIGVATNSYTDAKNDWKYRKKAEQTSGGDVLNAAPQK
jgi:hypothetical protein